MGLGLGADAVDRGRGVGQVDLGPNRRRERRLGAHGDEVAAVGEAMGFMGAGGQRVMTMAAVMIAAGVMPGGREAGSAGVKDRRHDMGAGEKRGDGHGEQSANGEFDEFGRHLNFS